MLTTPEAADPVVAPAPDASTTMAAPPGAAVAVRAVPRSRARRGRPPAIVRAHAAAWLCLSIFGFAMAIALASFDVPSPMLEILALGSAFVFAAAVLIATVRLLRAAVDVIRAPSDRTPMGALAAVGNLFVAGLGLAVGAMFAYVSTVGFSRGRQLRRFGRVQLPGLRRDQAWASPMSVDMSVPPPPGLADQWRENGKTEHASVAAFARLTLDLMALGPRPR